MVAEGYVERCLACDGAIWLVEGPKDDIVLRRAEERRAYLAERVAVTDFTQVPNRGHRAECPEKGRGR